MRMTFKGSEGEQQKPFPVNNSPLSESFHIGIISNLIVNGEKSEIVDTGRRHYNLVDRIFMKRAGENGGLQGDINIQREDFNKWFAGGLCQPVPHPISSAQEKVASQF